MSGCCKAYFCGVSGISAENQNCRRGTKNHADREEKNFFWNASKHKELSAKIVKLTKDIEKLKSEKDVLLDQLDCGMIVELLLSKMTLLMQKPVFPSWNSRKKVFCPAGCNS